MAEKPQDDWEEIQRRFQAILGSSSSSSSSGSKGFSPTQSAKAQYTQQLISVYLGLWGLKPPPGYIERVARSGMNIFEFEAHERAKPGFRNSPRYAEEKFMIGQRLAERMGFLR